MKAEAKKTFKYGFAITEQELRRIHDSLTTALSRVAAGQHPITALELKFKNGALAEPTSLDEIIGQENVGSKAIIRLKMTVQDKKDPADYWASLQLTNSGVDSEDAASVSYVVNGQDRDWVFVTSSELDERVGRIKRFNFEQIASSRGVRLVVSNAIFLGVMVVMLLGLATQQQRNLSNIQTLETAWRDGRITDTVRIMIDLAKSGAETTNSPSGIIGPLLWIFPVGFVLVGILWSAGYFFPAYNFCWGECVKDLERRQAIGKFVFGAIIVGVLVGITAAYFSGLLGIH